MIRGARAEDRKPIEALVRAAYSVYIDRIGKPPGPMLDVFMRKRITDNFP